MATVMAKGIVSGKKKKKNLFGNVFLDSFRFQVCGIKFYTELHRVLF